MKEENFGLPAKRCPTANITNEVKVSNWHAQLDKNARNSLSLSAFFELVADRGGISL